MGLAVVCFCIKSHRLKTKALVGQGSGAESVSRLIQVGGEFSSMLLWDCSPISFLALG